MIPGARLEWVENSRTFSPEDRPDRLAELIGDFAGHGARTPVSSRASSTRTSSLS